MTAAMSRRFSSFFGWGFFGTGFVCCINLSVPTVL